MKYIHEAIQLYESFPVEARKNTKPCTLEEIQAMETKLENGFKLPDAFKEFLSYGGHKMGNLFRGVDFSYKMVNIFLDNGHRDIHEMMSRYTKNTDLPADILIINEYIGSSFTYLLLSEGENPPIYFWEEGVGGLESVEMEAESFSDFLLLRMKEYQKTLKH